MERMKDMFMKELKEMNDKYSHSQTALDSLQSKYGEFQSWQRLSPSVDFLRLLVPKKTQDATIFSF